MLYKKYRKTQRSNFVFPAETLWILGDISALHDILW